MFSCTHLSTLQISWIKTTVAIQRFRESPSDVRMRMYWEWRTLTEK